MTRRFVLKIFQPGAGTRRGIRWRYRYDGEHRLTEVLSEPYDRNRPSVRVSFQYDPLGRRISKTRQPLVQGRPGGKAVTTRFVWEGFRLLQEIQDDVPLTYVYSAAQSFEPLARIDGVDSPEIFWFHCAANGMPERLTDREGRISWEGVNGAWGKLLRESALQTPGFAQNLRMQGQYLDRETGLHYNLFRYYDPDSGRFTQQDPIGLAGGLNLYAYAPNALTWIDPLGLSNFFTPSVFNAPSGSTHTVYQQVIDWDLPVNTRNGVKTNLDLALEGKSPFVVKNGKYSQINLHHSEQNGLGSLFELSADTHQKYYGTNALHPYLPNQHPINPVNRDTFNTDRDSYWRRRGENELHKRNLKAKCRG